VIFPYVQRPGTSLHVIIISRPFPTLVVQATNTGVRRPGYEARKATQVGIEHPCSKNTHLFEALLLEGVPHDVARGMGVVSSEHTGHLLLQLWLSELQLVWWGFQFSFLKPLPVPLIIVPLIKPILILMGRVG